MENQDINFMDEFNIQWKESSSLFSFLLSPKLAEPLKTQLEKYFNENQEERKNKVNANTVHLVFEKLVEQKAEIDIDAFKYVVSLCKNISLTNVCQIFEQCVNDKFKTDENITKLINSVKKLLDLCNDISIVNSDKLFESVAQEEIELDKDLFSWLKAEITDYANWFKKHSEQLTKDQQQELVNKSEQLRNKINRELNESLPKAGSENEHHKEKASYEEWFKKHSQQSNEGERQELKNESKRVQSDYADYDVTRVLDDESVLILNLLKAEYENDEGKIKKCKLSTDFYKYIFECSVDILRKFDDELKKVQNSEQNKQQIMTEKNNIKKGVADLFKSSMTIVSTVDWFIENPKLIFQLCVLDGIDSEIKLLKSVKKMDLGINMSNANGKLTDWINFLDKIGISLDYKLAFSCVVAYFSKTLSVAQVLTSIGVTSNVKTENDFDIDPVKMLGVCNKVYDFLTSDLKTDEDKKLHKDFMCALIKHFLPEKSDELQKLINDSTEDIIKAVLENLFYGVAELKNLIIHQEQTKTGQTVRKLFSVDGRNKNRISWFDVVESIWSKMKLTQAGENFIKALVKSVLYELLPYDFKNINVPLYDILISYLDQTQDKQKMAKMKVVFESCEKIVESMTNKEVSVAELLSDIIKLLDNLSTDGIENIDVKPLLDAIFSSVLNKNLVISICYHQLFEGKNGIAVIKPILEKIRDGIIEFGDLTIQTIKEEKIKGKSSQDEKNNEIKETIKRKLVAKNGKEINWFNLIKSVWKKMDQTDKGSLKTLAPPVLFELFLPLNFQAAKKFIRKSEDKYTAIGINENIKDMFNKIKEELNQIVPSKENILLYYKLFVQSIDEIQDENLKLSDEQKEIFEDLESESTINIKEFVNDNKDKYTKDKINQDVKDAFANLQNEFATTVSKREFILDKYKLFSQAIKNAKDKNLNLSDDQQKIFENLDDELWQEKIFYSAKKFLSSLDVKTANFESVCSNVIKLLDLITTKDLDQCQVLDEVKAIIGNMCKSENCLVSDSNIFDFKELIKAVLQNGKLLLKLTNDVEELKDLNNQQWFNGVFKNLSVLFDNRLKKCTTPNEMSSIFSKVLDGYKEFAQAMGVPLNIKVLKDAIKEFEKKPEGTQTQHNSILLKIMADEKIKAAYESLQNCVNTVDEKKEDFNLKQSLKNISVLYHNFIKVFNDSDVILNEVERKQFNKFKFQFEASQIEIINSVQGMLSIIKNMFLDTNPATRENNLTLKNLIKELIKNGEILKFVTAQSDELKAIQPIFNQAFPKLSELICLKLDKLESDNDNSDGNYNANARKESLFNFLENDIHGLLNVYNNFAEALGASSKNNPSYQKDIIVSVKNILSYVKNNFVDNQGSIKIYKTLLKEFLGEAIEDRNIKNIFGLRAQRTNILTFIIDKIDLKSAYKQDVSDFKNPLKNSLCRLTELITNFIDEDIEKNTGDIDNLLKTIDSLLDSYISFAGELDKPFNFSKAREFVRDKDILLRYCSSESENVRTAFGNLKNELEKKLPKRKNVMHLYKLLRNSIDKTKNESLKLSPDHRNIFESSELNQSSAITKIGQILDSVSNLCQYKKIDKADETGTQIEQTETDKQKQVMNLFKNVLSALLDDGKFLSYIIGEIDDVEAASINPKLKKYLKGISGSLCSFLISYLNQTEDTPQEISDKLKSIFKQYDTIMQLIQSDKMNISAVLDKARKLLSYLDENIVRESVYVLGDYKDLFYRVFDGGNIINLLAQEAKNNNPENMWFGFISDENISIVLGFMCRAIFNSCQTSEEITNVIDKSKQIYEIFSGSGEATQAEQNREKQNSIGKILTRIKNIFSKEVTYFNIKQDENPEYKIKLVFDYFTFDSSEEPNETYIGSQINEKNCINQEQIGATEENKKDESKINVADMIVEVFFKDKQPWYLKKIIMPLARKYFDALKNYVNEDKNADRKILDSLKSKIKSLARPWGRYYSYCCLRNLLIVRKQRFVRRVANYISQIVFAPIAILGLLLYIGINFIRTKLEKIFRSGDKKMRKPEIVVKPIIIPIEQKVISESDKKADEINTNQIEEDLNKSSHETKAGEFEDNIKILSDTKSKDMSNIKNEEKEPKKKKIISFKENVSVIERKRNLNKNEEGSKKPRIEQTKLNELGKKY